MSSINTNVAAMTALQSLTATNQSLSQTQQRISTGLRVNSASDNAAYWSIATTMRADTSALSTVQDALGLGAATIDVAYTTVEECHRRCDQDQGQARQRPYCRSRPHQDPEGNHRSAGPALQQRGLG